MSAARAAGRPAAGSRRCAMSSRNSPNSIAHERSAPGNSHVVVSGGPGRTDREKDPLVHHKVRTFETQRKVYEEMAQKMGGMMPGFKL